MLLPLEGYGCIRVRNQAALFGSNDKVVGSGSALKGRLIDLLLFNLGGTNGLAINSSFFSSVLVNASLA